MPPRANLKAHYLDDRKLAQLAWLEFARAMQTRRVVAFVGSMATEALGYPSWDDLVGKYFAKTLEMLDDDPKDLSDERTDKEWARKTVKEFEAGWKAKKLTPVVAMSLIGEVLESERIRRWKLKPPVAAGAVSGARQPTPATLPTTIPNPPGVAPAPAPAPADAPAAEWPLDHATGHLDRLSASVAQGYRQPSAAIRNKDLRATRPSRLKQIDVPELLFDALDIRRFATTNYDFEIERKTMLRDREKWIDDTGDYLNSAFESLRALRSASSDPSSHDIFDWDLGSGRIRRVLTHGKAAESDLLNRERIDRLIEFSIGTDDVDSHVMHLHGRACDWQSMIVTQRDYDRLYRRNDLDRLPFEFARRLLMGGNPILFVGLGMSEADLNRELREFISNDRYRRTAPAFLLWSAIPGAMNEDERRSFRLNMLHQFGVLTIFDTDFTLGRAQRELLREAKNLPRLPSGEKGQLPDDKKLRSLALSVEAVARQLKTLPREDHLGSEWRSASVILGRPGSPQHADLMVLWQRAPDSLGRVARNNPCAPSQKLLTVARRTPMLCILGSSGVGKGHASLEMAKLLSKQGPCLLINGGFSFDTDSMLSGITDFFDRYLSCKKDKTMSRGAYFLELAKHPRLKVEPPKGMPGSTAANSGRLYIVVNGAERFFSVNGDPLSAELDQLLHIDIDCVSWIIFGTERLRRNATKSLRADVREFGVEYSAARDWLQEDDGSSERIKIPFQYMRDLVDRVKARTRRINGARTPVDRISVDALSSGDWMAFAHEVQKFKALSAARMSGDAQPMRTAFYTWVLDGHVLAHLLGDGTDMAARECISLAHSMLRQLCFFGLPIERGVLCKVPALRVAARDLLKSKPPAGGTGKAISQTDITNEISTTLDLLVERHLVLRLAGYARAPTATGGAGKAGVATKPGAHRYALHRSLLADLRSRFAIPLSEAKLSTAFNMSLYVAQPVDGYIPEPAIHDELGGLMDFLMGEYREFEPGTAPARLVDAAATGGIALAVLERALTRAAHKAQSSEHRDERHKPDARYRIHRLCSPDTVQGMRAVLGLARGFYSTTGILTLDSGDRLVRDDRDGILLEHAERLDRMIDMHAKIDLARGSLRDTLGETVFHALYGEAEPFYAEELVWLHNERGVVRLAMGDLYEARKSFERALKVNHSRVEGNDRDHNWRRIRMNQLSVMIEMGEVALARRMAEEIVMVSERPKTLLKGGRRKGAPKEDSQVHLREDELAIAIANGHLGWCAQLQGDAGKARDLYQRAIRTLSKQEESRAQAFFQRLILDVGQSWHQPAMNLAEMEKTLALVQATRQMDLVHRFRIRLAAAYFHANDAEKQSKAFRMLDEALQYGLMADVPRVRCEAAMTIAGLRHRGGDHEGALRFASDALMIAIRYGMELRKTILRTDIARFMGARGHPITARRLARTTISVAARQRYQTAIDRAEEVLLEISQMSAALRSSDSSGRRTF